MSELITHLQAAGLSPLVIDENTVFPPPYPKFPLSIDSSMRSDFVSCPQKFFRRYLQHWQTSEKSIHLRAGGAFAAGMERTRRAYWEEGRSPEDSISLGAIALLKEYEFVEGDNDSPKAPYVMLLALDDYFRVHGWDTDAIQPLRLPDGKLALEHSFALPIPGVFHPVTGDPILYSGRFDMIGTFNGQLFLTDEKTTTYMGMQWRNQWRLRGQLTGYCWAAREFGRPVAGALVRGVSVQKTQTKHETVIEARPQWMIDRWLFQLQRDVRRMIETWEEQYFDFALDHACADFGGCPFVPVCTSNKPERWLETNFVKSEWSPIRIVGEA